MKNTLVRFQRPQSLIPSLSRAYLTPLWVYLLPNITNNINAGCYGTPIAKIRHIDNFNTVSSLAQLLGLSFSSLLRRISKYSLIRVVWGVGQEVIRTGRCEWRHWMAVARLKGKSRHFFFSFFEWRFFFHKFRTVAPKFCDSLHFGQPCSRYSTVHLVLEILITDRRQAALESCNAMWGVFGISLYIAHGRSACVSTPYKALVEQIERPFLEKEDGWNNHLVSIFFKGWAPMEGQIIN